MNEELFDWNVWAAPVTVLAFALTLGIIMAVRGWRSGADTIKGTGNQADREALAARKDALLERIRELDAERGKLDEAERLRRREELLAEATEVLKALEELDAAPVAGEGSREASAAASSSGGVSSGRASLVTGVVFVVVFALIGLMLGKYSADRAPGGSMTGNTSKSEIQEEVDAAMATLEQNPQDLDALNLLTYIAILQRDANNAMSYVDRARAVDPEDAEVLLHLGILRLMVGMNEQALASIQAAILADPTLGRALVWRGMAELSLGDRELAAQTLTAALGQDLMPVEQQLATQLLAEAKAPPPQDRLLGTVSVAEGLPTPTGGTLFLIVRSSAAGGGPPVASQRLQGAALVGKQAFVITDEDQMLGGDWPSEVWLSARLDGDGDPLTTDASDLVAPLMGPLSSGTEGLEVVLAAQDGSSSVAAAPSSASEPAPSGSAPRVKGSLDLADGAELPAGGVLFIIAQRSAQGGGPPVAVFRKDRADLSLPLDFTLGEGDMMIPGAWPEQVWVKARLDVDGNAMTRGDDDLEAPVVGPVGDATTPVNLVLGGS